MVLADRPSSASRCTARGTGFLPGLNAGGDFSDSGYVSFPQPVCWGLVVQLSGKVPALHSSKVKTAPVETVGGAFSWRTGMSTDVTDILRTTDLLGSASAADLGR